MSLSPLFRLRLHDPLWIRPSQPLPEVPFEDNEVVFYHINHSSLDSFAFHQQNKSEEDSTGEVFSL